MIRDVKPHNTTVETTVEAFIEIETVEVDVLLMLIHGIPTSPS